jgi:hypothetical protein
VIRLRFLAPIVAVLAVSLGGAAGASTVGATPATPATPAATRITPAVAEPMCESSSPGLCILSNSGQQITSTGSTPIKFNSIGSSFTINGVSYPAGTLNEPSISPACIGINGINNLVNSNCDTGFGTVWGSALSNGHHVFVSRPKSQACDCLIVFAASGSNGSVAFTSSFPPAAGVYERWDFAGGAALPESVGGIRLRVRSEDIRPSVFAPGKVHPHIADFKIKTLNGIHACVGYIFPGPGNPVVEKLEPGCEIMRAFFVTDDENGYAEYYIRFTSIQENSYMSATNDCTKVTQKSAQIDNGTVWIFYENAAGDLFLVPRYCNPNGSYSVQMGGQNNGDGAQWRVSASTSFYRRMNLVPA